MLDMRLFQLRKFRQMSVHFNIMHTHFLIEFYLLGIITMLKDVIYIKGM